MKAIVLTGGGSAGHVTPNIALIPHLQAKGLRVHYLGTKEGIESKLIAGQDDVEYHAVRSGKLRRYFSWKNFSDPFRVAAGFFDARKALGEIKPAAVFSKGGFVSVPVVMAAKSRRIPVVLHESDYTPGLANKIAIRFASTICVTFEDTLAHTRGKGVFTGTPIRGGLTGGSREKGLEFCGFNGEKPVLLIMGGSLGAQALNDELARSLDALLEVFDIAHLCGRGKLNAGLSDKAGYRQFEYVDEELSDLFAATDIAVSRAGANAVFEFLALAIPAVLIPLPLTASRGDQLQNAAYFEKRGYAVQLLQENIDRLTETVIEMYENREKYVAAMKACENADGTRNVLEQIMKAAGEL